MSKIKIILKDGDFLFDGKQIIFKAPCNGSEVTSLIIEDTEYSLVDSCNRDVSGCAYSFEKYAFVSALLDTENKKAYIINAGQHKLSSDLANGTFVVKKAEQASKLAYTTLPSYTDVDSVKEEGLYFLGYGCGYVNLPDDFLSGWLDVKKAGDDYVIQTLTGAYSMEWARFYGNSKWSAWRRCVTADELKDASNPFVVAKSDKANNATSADTSNIKKAESTQNIYYPVTLVSSLDEKAQTIHVTDKLSINPTTGALKASRFEGKADQATKDGNGNIITDTYTSKTDLQNGTITPKQADILKPSTKGSVTIPAGTSTDPGYAEINLERDSVYVFYGTLASGETFILNTFASGVGTTNGYIVNSSYSLNSVYDYVPMTYLRYDYQNHRLYYWLRGPVLNDNKDKILNYSSWLTESITFSYCKIASL